jgi:hypothetical protein
MLHIVYAEKGLPVLRVLNNGWSAFSMTPPSPIIHRVDDQAAFRVALDERRPLPLIAMQTETATAIVVNGVSLFDDNIRREINL